MLKWTSDSKHRQKDVFISEELFVKCKKIEKDKDIFKIGMIYFEGHAENSA